MTINVVEKIDDLVKVRHILVSVSDKSGLDEFIPQLVKINPDMKIFSTGGTYGRIKEILGSKAESCLTQVSDYTGQPETQGGLVKTLDFKIYLGLLTETYNDAHLADLKRTHSVPIDMVVVNLYPFKETISQPGVTVEQARGNIDIGGPCNTGGIRGRPVYLWNDCVRDASKRWLDILGTALQARPKSV
jgi:phosphoribosylaminoimidazolecarboxamide formyltransferase/IMP cyclohydrolase